MNHADLRIILTARDEASKALSEVSQSLSEMLPDLDDDATITIADVLVAREAWLEDAPAQYRNLLDATEEA